MKAVITMLLFLWNDADEEHTRCSLGDFELINLLTLTPFEESEYQKGKLEGVERFISSHLHDRR